MHKIISLGLFLSLCSLPIVANDALKSKEKEIDEMQKALEKKVLDYNEALKKQSETGTSPIDGQKKSTPQPAADADNDLDVMRNHMKQIIGRLEEIEMNMKKLAKGDKDIKFTDAKERDEATAKLAHTDSHSLNTSKALAQYNKAMSFLNSNDTKSAELAFKEILDVYPNDPYARNAMVRLGDTYVLQGKYSEAIDYYNRGLEKNLDGELYNDALLGKGKSLIEKGDRADACKIIIGLNKQNAPMTDKQNQRLQKLLLDGNCASKMDKDRQRQEEKDQAQKEETQEE